MKSPRAVWRCRDVSLPVSVRTHVMGILNVTPDSFSDGGRYAGVDAAVARGVEMAAGGSPPVPGPSPSLRPRSCIG